MRDDEKLRYSQTSEFPVLKDRPRIANVLKEIENRKDFTLGMISLLLASEVYKEIQAAGLYIRQYGESFEIDLSAQKVGKKREKIILKSKFSNTLQSVFALTRTLQTDFGKKGQIVANLFTTHLGIKIVSDRAFNRMAHGDSSEAVTFAKRRDLMLEALQLYTMPVGLYDGNWDEIPVAKIDPSVMFDIQVVNKNILLLRMNSYTKVDTNSFLSVVRMINEVMKRNPNDDVTQNWGMVKLRELELFAQSLEINWLHKVEYRVNRPLVSKGNKKTTKESTS